MTITEKKKEFGKILRRWHRNHYREMPWRNTHNAYRILVSELMLQQTQVARVREKYPVFIKQFPTVEILAAASLGDVLRMWSGLGYNRRAKYLHECAKRVVSLHGGKFPKDFATLMTLPGIGRSTAAAITAFAFNQDEPMIDTNTRRILTRVFFPSRTSSKIVVPSDKTLYEFAKMIIPRGGGRMWNYAMLDLGALLCCARNHSASCPLGELHGRVGDFVYKKPQTKFVGSRRYYRGRVLKALAEGHCTQSELVGTVDLENKELSLILQDLMSEKLVCKKGARFMLPR